MNHDLSFTLICDGPFDRTLIPIISWTLRSKGFSGSISTQWADLGSVSSVPSRRLDDRISASMRYFPASVYFIHRDAEFATFNNRAEEIHQAWTDSGENGIYRILIPIRMTEAWLLFNERAIRTAAGNPNGTVGLNIPPLNRHERIPSPKNILHNALLAATEFHGRRRKKFQPRKVASQVAELIDDFSALHQLSAFNEFENEVERLLNEDNWTS